MENGTREDIGYIKGSLEGIHRTLAVIMEKQGAHAKELQFINRRLDQQEGSRKALKWVAGGGGGAGLLALIWTTFSDFWG